jgi:hypothetical protein
MSAIRDKLPNAPARPTSITTPPGVAFMSTDHLGTIAIQRWEGEGGALGAA